MALCTTQVILTNHARQRLQERLPGMSPDDFTRVLKSQGRSARCCSGLIVPKQYEGRFCLAVQQHKLLCVVDSKRAGEWIIVTLWNYEESK